MVAAPWFLLAGGIVLIVIGYFLASLGRGDSDRVFINPKMSDEDIAREMNKPQGNLLANLVMIVGFLAVLVSIGWRLVRIFVRSP